MDHNVFSIKSKNGNKKSHGFNHSSTQQFLARVNREAITTHQSILLIIMTG
jgi:hypothetical protein